MKQSAVSMAYGGIKNFFSAMLPDFEKSRIMDDLAEDYKELNILKEMYSVMPNEIDDYILASNKELVRQMERYVKDYRNTITGHIQEVTDLRLKESTELESFIDDIYGRVVLKDNMDYRKVQMVRFIDGLAFYIKYAKALLLVSTTDMVNDLREGAKIKGMRSVVVDEDREFIRDSNNIRSFAIMSDALAKPVKEIRDALNKMSKVQFDEQTHDMMVKSNGVDADPLRMGLLPVIGSFVYHVGLAINNYLAYRQEATKEELERLQVQVMLLRRLKESEVDKSAVAKLDKQIKYYDNRINKLRGKLEDMVDD